MVMGAIIVVGCIEPFPLPSLAYSPPPTMLSMKFPPAFCTFCLLLDGQQNLPYPFPLHPLLCHIYKTLYFISSMVVLSSLTLPFIFDSSTTSGSQIQDVGNHLDELKSFVIPIPVMTGNKFQLEWKCDLSL